MGWTRDPKKNSANLKAHGLSLETASHVFDDPLAASRPDFSSDEERWQTVGTIGNVAVLVVHTWPESLNENIEVVGRLITARKATARERKAYEDGEF